MIHHIKRATRHLIFWSLMTIALGLSAMRLVLSGVDLYKANLARHISETIGAPVLIGRIGARMRGLNPELVLKNINIASDINEKPAVALKEIRLGINVFDLLLNRAVLPSAWVTLVGAKVSVQRKDDGSFAIIGLKARDDGQPLWLFQGSKFEVLQSEVTWLDDSKKSKPLKFASVDLAIINSGERHKINVLAKLPPSYGDLLTVSADFSGDPFTASAIDGVVYLDGKSLQPAQWRMADWPLSMTIRSGIGNAKFWGHLKQSQWVSVSGDVQLQDVNVLRHDKKELTVKALSTGFNWRQDERSDSNDRQWQLDVRRFLLDTAEPGNHIRKWPNAVFSVSGRINSDAVLQQIGLTIKQLDVKEASRIAQFFAPLSTEDLSLLAQADAQGLVNRLSLSANLHERTFAVDGSFTGLAVAPVLAMPGIQNISGQIKGTDKQGTVRLATHDASVASPGLFREALTIKRLDGAINWRQQDDGWHLFSSKLKLDVLGLQSESRLRVTLPKHSESSPFVDLQTELVCHDVSQLKHYFPTGVMKPVDIQWLDRAFVSGQVHQGRLFYYGKLGQLAKLANDSDAPQKIKPFKSPSPDILPGEEGAVRVLSAEMLGGDLFEALLDVSHLELDYAPDWPRITDISGELRFLQGRMEVNADQGYSNKLKASRAVVINEAVGKSNKLLVKGEVEGEIAEALAFLQQTPLNSRVGSLIDAITPQGATRITLDLLIPLAQGVEPKVDGSAVLDQAGLTVKAVDLAINNINGLLKFNEDGIYSDTIHASALNRPIRITVDNADNQTRVNVSGSAEVSDIEKQFGLPDGQIAEGAMAYRLKLILPYEHVKNHISEQVSELLVDSDLTGVALRLPDELAKTKTEAKALSVVFKLGDQALLPIAIRYDDKLKAAIRFDTAKQRIDSGHLLFGKGEAVQADEAGLKLEINRNRLDLKDWLMLSGDGQQASNIREIKIHSDHAQWGNTALGAFDLALKPDAHEWTGRINSAFAAGKMRIPMPMNTGRISLDMDMLDLSALKQLKAQSDAASSEPLFSAEESTENIPLFNITSYKTLWQSVDLGLLAAQTDRIPDGIALTKLELSGLVQKLGMSGVWKQSGDHTETFLKGHLDMPNAGSLLSRLGVTSDLVETNGDADFSVHWQGAPYQFSLAALQGDVDLAFSNGRILSIEPGFGRMLGVLAMAQWTKRLQLDFRDIYEEGLTFNSIKGHFKLLHGKASTQNLVVDAIPATITITGDTDLVSKTVDQLVNVVPKGAEAVPIAGTIMGKVTTLIARTVTGEDQDGFLLGSQYVVKGRWDTMQVIPLHDRDGLLQKTWTGITHFPWLQQSQ